jgi:two-component system, OmpR family, phosphate regulon response regulator PhoB
MASAILVVEDDAATRDLLAGNLVHAGYRVSCARDLAEARAHTSKARPDLVLLDRTATGGTTLTYARQLRCDRRTEAIAIIVIGAAFAHEQDAVAVLESGADDYVARPFSANMLLARIKAVMRRRAPQIDDKVLEFAGPRPDPVAVGVRKNGRGPPDAAANARAAARVPWQEPTVLMEAC